MSVDGPQSGLFGVDEGEPRENEEKPTPVRAIASDCLRSFVLGVYSPRSGATIAASVEPPCPARDFEREVAVHRFVTVHRADACFHHVAAAQSG